VVTGSFRYRDDPAFRGTLVYARLGVTPGHSWDVRAYARSNANFPASTTLAQLYDDAEFEAYRAMGEGTASDVVDTALADTASSGRTAPAPLDTPIPATPVPVG